MWLKIWPPYFELFLKQLSQRIIRFSQSSWEASCTWSGVESWKEPQILGKHVGCRCLGKSEEIQGGNTGLVGRETALDLLWSWRRRERILRKANIWMIPETGRNSGRWLFSSAYCLASSHVTTCPFLVNVLFRTATPCQGLYTFCRTQLAILDFRF